MRVFVLDKNKKPLDPCPTGTAWKLLKRGRAAVFRRFPFTIILKDRTLEESTVHEHRVKIDPGSNVTGIAVVQEETGTVVAAGEIEHRGQRIRASLQSRRTLRRGRRARKTRYRQPRFDNRTRPKGWLPPSLASRIANVLTWVARLRRFCPVAALSQELVKFDTQAMENPEISGVEYQQGTLLGYEVREYLLEKWQRRCAYCGRTGVPLQVEHIHPKSKGGTDRVSNLALACDPCNDAKANRPIEEFLKCKPKLLAKIEAQAQAPLRDAAAINATRWELWRRLKVIGLPVECGSGGRTKFNRTMQGYPKAHWIDAACVGVSGESVHLDAKEPFWAIKAMGQGKRQICRTDKFGFPFRWCPRSKKVQGFQTGDLVRAEIPSGKYAGTHTGRVAVRSTGSFQIGTVVSHVRHIRLVQHVDGYQYTTRRRDSSTPEGCGAPRDTAMNPNVRKLFDLGRLHDYKRAAPLVLINGLAEQSESWFSNRVFWSRHFDVKVPELLVYDGASLHKWIDAGGEITVDYLTDRLAAYLDEYVQRPPYNLVGSSLGGQVVLTYAIRHPQKVARLALICPSGFFGDENLPMMEGVRRSHYDTLVKSVFHRGHFASEALVGVIARKFQDRQWKKGMVRTLRGTVGHSVAPLLPLVEQQTLIIWGANDRVISDVTGSIRAANQVPRGRQVVIPRCGHAPQIEKARLVNELVLRFFREKLKTIPPALDPRRFLAKQEERSRLRQPH